MFFNPFQKGVILSEALADLSPNTGSYGAESKDPGDVCWQMLFEVFRQQITREIKKPQPPSAVEGICSSLRTFPGDVFRRSEVEGWQKKGRRFRGGQLLNKSRFHRLRPQSRAEAHDSFGRDDKL
jgi:hypothetical protein